MYDATDGVPFFVVQLVTHLVDVDATTVAPADVDEWLTQVGLPASIRDVVDGRLALLDPDVRSFLDVCAVAGSRCRASPLRRREP